MTEVQAVSYVAWFNIRDGINHDDPATADLQQVTVASAGSLAKAPNAAIDFTPLLTSSDRSELLPVDDVKMPDPAKMLAGFKPEGGPRVIAARVHGVLKSAFSGPPPLTGDQKRPDNFPAHKAQTDGPANLVVVADSDILADRFWVRIADFFGQQTATPFSDNGPFVANLIGTLSGSDALIGLRSRGDTNRPFTLVAAMQSDAEAQYPPDPAGVAAASGRGREAVAHAALRRRERQGRGGHHARTARRHRHRAAGHPADPRQAARGAVGAEPRHLPPGDRDADLHHRAGAGGADRGGDHHGRPATTPSREGTPMRAVTLAALVVAGAAAVAGGWYYGAGHDAARADRDLQRRPDVPRAGREAA